MWSVQRAGTYTEKMTHDKVSLFTVRSFYVETDV